MKFSFRLAFYALVLFAVAVIAYRWEEFRFLGIEMLNPFSQSLPVFEQMGGDFVLYDTDGNPMRMEDYAPKTILLTFGYTFCPDVCPLVLTDMVNVYKKFDPSEREKIQMLFITLDPDRDTPDQIKQYLNFFDPSLVGLRGTNEEIRVAARAFKVGYVFNREQGNENYTIGHGYYVYLLDSKSRVRGFVNSRENLGALENDLRKLLGEI